MGLTLKNYNLEGFTRAEESEGKKTRYQNRGRTAILTEEVSFWTTTQRAEKNKLRYKKGTKVKCDYETLIGKKLYSFKFPNLRKDEEEGAPIFVLSEEKFKWVN
jgi:hypothetical protein